MSSGKSAKNSALEICTKMLVVFIEFKQKQQRELPAALLFRSPLKTVFTQTRFLEVPYIQFSPENLSGVTFGSFFQCQNTPRAPTRTALLSRGAPLREPRPKGGE